MQLDSNLKSCFICKKVSDLCIAATVPSRVFQLVSRGAISFLSSTMFDTYGFENQLDTWPYIQDTSGYCNKPQGFHTVARSSRRWSPFRYSRPSCLQHRTKSHRMSHSTVKPELNHLDTHDTNASLTPEQPVKDPSRLLLLALYLFVFCFSVFLVVLLSCYAPNVGPPCTSRLCWTLNVILFMPCLLTFHLFKGFV